jgi:hypothetical protein
MGSKLLSRIPGRNDAHASECLKAIERGLHRRGVKPSWTSHYTYDLTEHHTERAIGFELRIEKLDTDGQLTYRNTGIVRYTAIVRHPTDERNEYHGMIRRTVRREVHTVADAVDFAVNEVTR